MAPDDSAGESGYLTAAQYMEEVLPKFVAANTERFRRGPLVCVFDLTGEEGGTWVVDLTRGTVEEGTAEDPAFTLTTSEAMFNAILNEEGFDIQQALKDGTVTFEGEPSLLKAVSLMLASARIEAPGD